MRQRGLHLVLDTARIPPFPETTITAQIRRLQVAWRIMLEK
jgi:hypothetical protein